ncbi:uncharacterized protein LOC111267036 [Varroa jacobsoni]|uniref:Uncharacterized protein n=1 Tax=Varroa destructor TaxID=109461 RepID=A0A7M7KM83_VARDE|nr:uncharacterized protein LOC111253550 [Varroa destructor]XP_022700718.1 uncharacterized protein LOC111267036 [Varroa jacobsoni]
MDRVSVSSVRPPDRYPRPTCLLVASGWMAFISSLVLLVAYAAPYWLESYWETRSETQFIRLGLWEVCFNRYMHPPYQYDEVFDGCHWIHGYYYQNIRDWLMPGWFMFTQAMLTLGLMFELTALIVLSILLMRYLLRYEIVILTAAFVLEALTALLLFLGVSVFGGMAFSRYWLLYPNFNHLGWGYAFAVIAMFFHAFTACMLLKEAFNSKERRRRDNNLVYNMQPRGEPMRY